MAPVIVEPQQPSVEPLEDVTVFEYRDDPGEVSVRMDVTVGDLMKLLES